MHWFCGLSFSFKKPTGRERLETGRVRKGARCRRGGGQGPDIAIVITLKASSSTLDDYYCQADGLVSGQTRVPHRKLNPFGLQIPDRREGITHREGVWTHHARCGHETSADSGSNHGQYL